MFLIDHSYKGITKFEHLSAAAAEICSPFSGCPGKHCLVGSCKELTVFWRWDEDEEPNQNGEGYDGSSFHQYQTRLSLWNPTTNVIKTLPLSKLPHTLPVLRIDIGENCVALGFDPRSRDYKLLCFPEYTYSDLSDSWGQFNIELYSLKTDSWKWINPPSFGCHNPAIPRFPSHSIHINGVFYWVTTSILSFDFTTEKFSKMSLPARFLQIDENNCLAEYHESLAIIIPYSVPAEDLTREEKKKQLQQPFSIKIWVRKGRNWNLAPRVAVGDFPVGDRVARVLGLFQNEYLFLQGFNDAEVFLFNCKTGKLENLGFQRDPPISCFSVRKPGIFPCTVPDF